MVVGAKVCELTKGFLRFVCGLYVGILKSPLNSMSYSPGDSTSGIYNASIN